MAEGWVGQGENVATRALLTCPQLRHRAAKKRDFGGKIPREFLNVAVYYR